MRGVQKGDRMTLEEEIMFLKKDIELHEKQLELLWDSVESANKKIEIMKEMVQEVVNYVSK